MRIVVCASQAPAPERRKSLAQVRKPWVMFSNNGMSPVGGDTPCLQTVVYSRPNGKNLGYEIAR